MAFVQGKDTDEAYTGAVLVAEFLRTVRDWDRNNFPGREW
jgi:hypothetical protein